MRGGEDVAFSFANFDRGEPCRRCSGRCAGSGRVATSRLGTRLARPLLFDHHGGPEEFSISIWTVPGAMTAELYFVGGKDRVTKLPQASEARVQLLPSGATSKARAFWPKPSWSGVLGVTVYDDPHFLDKLAQANQVGVTTGSQSLAIPLQGAAKPMQALKGCMDDKLREWGVDPATLPAPDIRPTGDLNSWITPEDYPTDALDSNTSGIVVVRLTTDGKGKVTNCAVVENTGTKSMGTATCQAARKRARYNPATDPDGQPIPATFITYTAFRVFS